MLTAKLSQASNAARAATFLNATNPIGTGLEPNVDLIDQPFVPSPLTDPATLHIASFPGYTQFATSGPAVQTQVDAPEGDLWYGGDWGPITWTCSGTPTPALMYGVLISLRVGRSGPVEQSIALAFSRPVPILAMGDTITVADISVLARYAAFIGAVTGTHV